MRKYLVGFLVGAALMFGTQVFAVSKIGKMVEGEITVLFDGTELETTGIVIEGTSYLPLRAIGTVMGLNVDYVDGKAILSTPLNKEGADLEQLTEEIREQVKKEIMEEIKQDQENAERLKKINSLKEAIANLEDQLANPEKYGLYTDLQKQVVIDIIENYKQQLAELEAASE